MILNAAVALGALVLGQATVPTELDLVWHPRSAVEREATARSVVASLWAVGDSVGMYMVRDEARGPLWAAEYSVSGTPIRIQHDGDSDEWLLNRLDLAPVLPIPITSLDASRELIAIRDRLVALGLLDESSFRGCTPEIVETRMGGGQSGEPVKESVVELTARCRADYLGVAILNLGIQVRLRAGGVSSIRFSRARVVPNGRHAKVALPQPLAATDVAREWPRLRLKESRVAYLAEEKPGRGQTSVRLVQFVAGAEVATGGVARTRVLVRKIGDSGWTEPALGEQKPQSGTQR